MFRALFAQKDEIERRVGEPLVWMTVDDAQRRRRAFVWIPAKLDDRADWPRQHRWLREELERMAGVDRAGTSDRHFLASG